MLGKADFVMANPPFNVDGVDAERLIAAFRSILRGPDAIFGLLRYYLSQLQVTQADQVVFVADGAAWIWERVGKLVSGLGLRADQVVEVVDFYHAVEHLGKVAALQTKWSANEIKVTLSPHTV